MLMTALAQLRFAASVVFGIPFSPWSLDRLLDALLATQREFGSIGSEGDELVNGPTLDPETRREVALRRFRTQATRASRETAYYERLFRQLNVEPSLLTVEEISQIPLTPKVAPRTAPDDFVRKTSRTVFRAATTGTTGRPTSIAFSQNELRTIVGLSAIGHLISGQIGPDDIVLICNSARAALGNLGVAGACAKIGAEFALLGQIEPAATLARLAEERRILGKQPRVSVLCAYPSYLGELVEAARDRGYRPSDFGVRRILTGGEILTEGLRAHLAELFGPVTIGESYAMTETIPFGANRCDAGHLHFEPAHGLLEVIGLQTGRPAEAGEAGTIVATPFPPFRETTILLRYDTEDVVRVLSEEPRCGLRQLPGASALLGKRRLAVPHEAGWTFPRDVLEAVEGDSAVPLPARCGFWPVAGGVAVEVVVRSDTAEARRSLERRLTDTGVPLRALSLVADRRALRHPLPLRCDLRDHSFPSPLWSENRVNVDGRVPTLFAG